MVKGGLVKSRGRWFLESMVMILVVKSHRTKILIEWKSCQRMYRDDNTNKTMGDRDDFGNCVFQQPVASVLIYKRRNLQWLKWEHHPSEEREWTEVLTRSLTAPEALLSCRFKFFYSFTNCKQLQHNRCLLESFSAQLIASCTWTGRIHHLLGSLISKPQHFFSFHCVLPSSTPALKSSYSSFHILHPSPLILKGMISCPLL